MKENNNMINQQSIAQDLKMKENNKMINQKSIAKDLLIALLFSTFALALLYLFEIFTRN